MKLPYYPIGIIVLCMLVLVALYGMNSISSSALTAHLAGTWYEGTPAKLKKQLLDIDELAKKQYGFSMTKHLVDEEEQQRYIFSRNPFPVKAVVVPHAGYSYSGAVAAGAYQAVDPHLIKRVIVLAPIHERLSQSFVVTKATQYCIPGSAVTLDDASAKKIATQNNVVVDDSVFNNEHSFEMQVPLLAHYFPDAIILPILIGAVTSEDIDSFVPVIQSLVDNQTLLVISSDITHYGPRFGGITYDDHIPQRIALKDSAFLLALEKGDSAKIEAMYANGMLSVCGINHIRVLMRLMRHSWFAGTVLRVVAYDTSADTDNMVTYAGCIVAEDKYMQILNQWEQDELLKYARRVLGKESDNRTYGKNFSIDTPTYQYLRQALHGRSSSTVSFGQSDMSALPLVHMRLLSRLGAFVTLSSVVLDERIIQACVGRVITDKTLLSTIHDITRTAAVSNNRSTPLTLNELDSMDIEISLLTPPRPVGNYTDIMVGAHGIVLHKKNQEGIDITQALFLPQETFDNDMKPVEYWLSRLSEKAGLSSDGWQESDVSFEVFEAVRFSDALSKVLNNTLGYVPHGLYEQNVPVFNE